MAEAVPHRVAFVLVRIGGDLRANRLVETDTQQLGAARRVCDRLPRGAKPLRAAHRQRYPSCSN
jgi:hypothetical protein